MNEMGERGRLKLELQQLIGPVLPAAFIGGSPKALPDDIEEQLVARYPDVNPMALRLWLSRWKACPAYLKKLKYALHYYDLDGRQIAPIEDDARRAAERARANHRNARRRAA